MAKPKVFIASSVERLKVANAVQQNLAYYAESTVWNQSMFRSSSNTLDDLSRVLLISSESSLSLVKSC